MKDRKWRNANGRAIVIELMKDLDGLSLGAMMRDPIPGVMIEMTEIPVVIGLGTVTTMLGNGIESANVKMRLDVLRVLLRKLVHHQLRS